MELKLEFKGEEGTEAVMVDEGPWRGGVQVGSYRSR
jgi:hypothetical protein